MNGLVAASDIDQVPDPSNFKNYNLIQDSKRFFIDLSTPFEQRAPTWNSSWSAHNECDRREISMNVNSHRVAKEYFDAVDLLSFAGMIAVGYVLFTFGTLS